MGKSIKIISITLVGILLLFSIVSCSGSETRVVENIPPSNVFEIEGFEMLTGREGANFRVTAETASFNKLENIADLNFLTIEFEDGSEKITAKADKGYFLQNNHLVAEGNIEGETKEFTFFTSENGIMNYDLGNYTGVIENDVTCKQGENTIKSDKVIMDFKTKITEFSGNASITYFM